MSETGHGDALRRLAELSPEQLQRLLTYLEGARSAAAAQVVSVSSIGTEGAVGTPHVVQEGTADVAARLWLAHVTDRLTAVDEVTAELEPEVAEVVAVAEGLWADVRPRSPEQMLAYLQVLTPLIRLLIVLAAAAGLTGVAVANEDVRSFVLEAVQALPRVTGEPPSPPAP